MLTYLFDEQLERENYEATKDKEMIAEGFDLGEKKGIEIGEKRGIEIGEKRGISIGKKEGIEIGKINTLIDLVKQNLLPIESAAKAAKMTVAEFASLPEMKKA